MYLEHFGLRESPFRITPHTEFFFTGANRGATLEALIYATTHDEGIVKVSGEVGSGKTMLCRMLLERLPGNVDTVYLADPALSREEILFAIADELHSPLPEGRPHALVRALQDRLIEAYANGRQVVAIVDEAHAMPPETLEEIRLLSNLETNRHKLLHIVLFGQPELDERLADVSMRQLRERVTHNFALEPLRRQDVEAYLTFRLRAAGYQGPNLFTPSAIQLISHASEGLTRRINILADKALLSAFSENRHQIDRKQIRDAIRDAQFRPMRDLRPHVWLHAGVGVSVATACGLFLGSLYLDRNSLPEPPAATGNGQALPPQPPVAPPSAGSGGDEPLAATPTADAARMPIDIEKAVVATDAWLRSAPASHYVIQLLRTDGSDRYPVDDFLENEAAGLDTEQIRIYRSRLSGRERYGIIYGDFPSRAAAQAELDRIKKNSAAPDYYIRAISKLR